MMRIILLILMLVPMPGHGADEEEINELLDGFHAAASASDFEGYFSHFAADAYFLRTDASVRWSVSAFKAYAEPAFAAGQGWTYRVLDRNLETRPNSETVWFDEILMNAKLGRCRGTGVVIREAGQWKIAYYSLTLLIPNSIADDVGKQSMKVEALSE